jgi:hypothetical protein
MILSPLLDSETSSFIHFSQISHGPVTWPPLCPIGLQQDPVVMGFTILVPAGFSDEQIKIYRIASILSRDLVFTTWLFNEN